MRPAKPEKGALLGGLQSRLERSTHVFLAGLVAAFAVEIVVDWNATFYEINVLRDGLKQKGMHYANIARLAAADPLATGDRARLGALAGYLFEDEEVIYVRITDGEGALLAEQGEPLMARYPKQMRRDVENMLKDTEGFRQRIAASRHRDFFQAVGDAQDRVIGWFAKKKAPQATGKAADFLAYQDRLYREPDKKEDRSLTWSLGLVEARDKAAGAAPAGLVLVAFKTDLLQRGIDKKLLKGLLITVFFLGVIAVQQLSSRRAKLRLLSLRDALAAARAAMRATLAPTPPPCGDLEGAIAYEQAERLGGTVYDFHVARRGESESLDVFIAIPEGSGVDVAFASVFLRDEQRRLWKEHPEASVEELFPRLLATYHQAPIHRRLELVAFRIDPASSTVRGVVAGSRPPLVRGPDGAPVAPTLEDLPRTDEDQLVASAIRRFSAAFPPGATLAVYDDGLPREAAHPLSDEAIERTLALPLSIAETADRLRQATLDHARELQDDLLVIVLRRRTATDQGKA